MKLSLLRAKLFFKPFHFVFNKDTNYLIFLIHYAADFTSFASELQLVDSITVDSRIALSRNDFLAWLVCLSSGLFFFYEFFQLNIFDVINQTLRDDFHLNATQISWMSSSYLWADIIFLLPAGIILDRVSTRKVILSSMLSCVIGTLGFALTRSFTLACIFHFLTGIGNAFCFLSCAVLVSNWFPSKRQALVLGCIVTMAFLGGMMAHTPFAHLSESYGWRSALLFNGFAGLLILFWIHLIVKDSPNEQLFKSKDKNILISFITVLNNRQNWLAGLYTSFLNLPIMVLCALWGASYLQGVHHLSEIAASKVVNLLFVGSILGCPLMGWFSDRQGRRKPIMILGAFATIICIIPLFININLSTSAVSCLFFFLGFFCSTQVVSYPLIAESNPPETTGVATGLASVLIMGGGGFGQVIFGWLMQQHAGFSMQHYHLSDFKFAMWIFPITAIAALFAVMFTKETYCKKSLRSIDADGR